MQTQVESLGLRENTSASAGRRNAPVFVLGCPRSGTTVLYHMLLSAGGFAVYRTESNVFNLLAPRFSGMRSVTDRRQLMNHWLRSVLFRRSGINAGEIEARVVAECRNAGDFLRLAMEEVARVQNVERWADCTPEHLLYMRQIKRQIPDALFIHIIRDGRDVALSYVKQGWSYPLPWDGEERLGVAGLYWRWMVRKGRQQGKHLGVDYREVRFEDLVRNPRQTLSELGKFIAHDLDYDRIRSVGIGSVSRPNSSFASESEGGFDPVERWKKKMSSQQIAAFEDLAGDCLREFEYPIASKKRMSMRAGRLRTSYFAMFEGKRWIKDHTPLGRLVRLGRIEIVPQRPHAEIGVEGQTPNPSFPD
ncbi:MAG: sulfotransferase [Candidatus Sulfotelmatobacter sp.]